jgi:hypothetical protein
MEHPLQAVAAIITIFSIAIFRIEDICEASLEARSARAVAWLENEVTFAGLASSGKMKGCVGPEPVDCFSHPSETCRGSAILKES